MMSTSDMCGENANLIFLLEPGSRSTALLALKVQVLLVNASCGKLMLYLMSLLAFGGDGCDKMVDVWHFQRFCRDKNRTKFVSIHLHVSESSGSIR